MEKTSSFLINHLHSKIFSCVNDLDNIPIHLHIVCDEPLEIGICNAFLQNNCIQFLPQNALGFFVFKLHVID